MSIGSSFPGQLVKSDIFGGGGGFDTKGGALFEVRWLIYCEYQKQVHNYAAVIDYVQNVRRTRPVSALFLRMLNLHRDPYCC